MGALLKTNGTLPPKCVLHHHTEAWVPGTHRTLRVDTMEGLCPLITCFSKPWAPSLVPMEVLKRWLDDVQGKGHGMVKCKGEEWPSGLWTWTACPQYSWAEQATCWEGWSKERRIIIPQATSQPTLRVILWPRVDREADTSQSATHKCVDTYSYLHIHRHSSSKLWFH